MRMYSVSFGFSYLKDRKGNFVVLSDYILLSEKRKLKKEKSSLFVLLLVHKYKNLKNSFH